MVLLWLQSPLPRELDGFAYLQGHCGLQGQVTGPDSRAVLTLKGESVSLPDSLLLCLVLSALTIATAVIPRVPPGCLPSPGPHAREEHSKVIYYRTQRFLLT